MRTLLTTMFCLALSLPARAQGLDINLDSLSAKAKEKAEVTLEGSLLTQALQKAPEKVKGAVANVSRVVVRHYEFATDGQYADSDLDAIRKQVSTWSRIINVKEEHESTEIYMLSQNGKTAGFLLISAEPKELTVVHIVGSIDLTSLQAVVNSTIHYNLKETAGQ
jgi:Domain of unknown function (DUF4252)